MIEPPECGKPTHREGCVVGTLMHDYADLHDAAAEARAAMLSPDHLAGRVLVLALAALRRIPGLGPPR